MFNIADLLAAMLSVASVDQPVKEDIVVVTSASAAQQSPEVFRYEQADWLTTLKIQALQYCKCERNRRNDHIMDVLGDIVDRQLSQSMFSPNTFSDRDLIVFKQEVDTFLFGIFLNNMNMFLEGKTFGNALAQQYLSIEKYEEKNSILRNRFDAFFTKYRDKMLQFRSKFSSELPGQGDVEGAKAAWMLQSSRQRLTDIAEDIVFILDDFGQRVKQMECSLTATATAVHSLHHLPSARKVKPLEAWAIAGKCQCLKSLNQKRLYDEQIWDFLYYVFLEHFVKCSKMKNADRVNILNQQFDNFHNALEELRKRYIEQFNLPGMAEDVLPYIDEHFKDEFLKAQQIPLHNNHVSFSMSGDRFVGMHFNIRPVSDVLFENIDRALARIPEEILQKKEEAFKQQVEAVRKKAVSRDETRRSLIGNWDALLSSEQAAWEQLIVSLSEKHQMPDLVKDASDYNMGMRRKFQALAVARHVEVGRAHQEKLQTFERGLDNRDIASCEQSQRAVMPDFMKILENTMLAQAKSIAAEKVRMMKTLEAEIEQKQEAAKIAEQERVLKEQEENKRLRHKVFADTMFRDKDQRLGQSSLSKLTDLTMQWQSKVRSSAHACESEDDVATVVVPTVVVSASACAQSNVVAQRKPKPARLPLPTLLEAAAIRDMHAGVVSAEFEKPVTDSSSVVVAVDEQKSSTLHVQTSADIDDVPVLRARRRHDPYNKTGFCIERKKVTVPEDTSSGLPVAWLGQYPSGQSQVQTQHVYSDDVNPYYGLELGYDMYGQAFWSDLAGRFYMMNHVGLLVPYAQQQGYAQAASDGSSDQQYQYSVVQQPGSSQQPVNSSYASSLYGNAVVSSQQQK